MATRPTTAVLSLAKFSVPEKIAKGEYIVQQWAKYGSNFPKTFTYAAADLDKAVQDLSARHAATQGGGTLATAEEKAALAHFDLLFGAYRDWANQPDVAYNDAVKIGQLGLDASRPPTPSGAMPKLVLLPLAGTNKGELDVVIESFGKFAAIILFVAYGDEVPADDAYAYCCGTTKLRTTLKLDSKKNCWVRALAVGPNGDGPLSDAVERMVL